MILPDVVRSYLADQMTVGKSAAYVTVSASGHYISAAGALARYGLSGMAEGDLLCDRLPFLKGYFPLSAVSEVLPRVHIGANLIADIHLIAQQAPSRFSPQTVLSNETEGGIVLLLDTTVETKRQQKLYQSSNELSLIKQQQGQHSQPRASITEPEDSTLISSVLLSLNLLVLEYTTLNGQPFLAIVGRLPEWASQNFECLQQHQEQVPAEQVSPFLENFLYDAQAAWQEQNAPYVRSGAWSETGALGEEITLEAVALSIESRSILLVEPLDVDRSEKFHWLQTARQKQLNLIEERRATASQIQKATSYDTLTGLPNRNLFLSELESLFEVSQWSSAKQFALVVLDLDRFQLLNNSLGSEMGDQVLIAVANRIRDCLRQFDIPVRFSSDEFGILLTQIEAEESVEAIAKRLLETINQPFVINGTKTYFTASAGIALSAPWYRHSRDLLRDASLAMQAAKLNNRGGYVMFKRDMRTRAFELWNLESALDTAVERNELKLFYQPIVNLSDNRVKGFEALIRWNHPQRGHIPPAKFIPLAEESGRILGIDNWVFKEACRTIQQWKAVHKTSACLNINVSPQHFDKGGLFDSLQSAMQQADISPRSICLEITESCLLRDTKAVIKTLNQLKNLGVQIAIDDFGTGYASLGYLQDLPLDKLKIDGYFVEMMKSNGSEIVNTVVELAHRLKFNVTAERVETIEQYKMLKKLGCDMGQGYLFSKPLPAEEARGFVDAQVVVSR